MTKDNKNHVLDRKPAKCEDCGKFAELRPYGKNGKNVCYECGMENPMNALAMYAKRIGGGA